MDVFELISSDSHIFPHKPKPLCSCWIGDRMIDMNFVGFDVRKINWGRVYKGHNNHDYDEFWENIKIIDEEDEVKLLSAFLVEQGLAEEYVRWKRDLTDYDVHHYDRWVDQIKEYVEEINEDFEYDREFIIKLCLSYTLQSLRNGEDLKRFQWGMINDE